MFPPEVSPEAALDFYIQCCSIEVNTQSAAGIAATLANGGRSPLTGVEVLATSTVKSVLTLMFSCGMYDYSGEWCVHVGLPAKSGVAGLVYVVIPHVMGIAIYSPPLDSHGNSVKGVEFCKALLKLYPYGIFDALTGRHDRKTAGEYIGADSGFATQGTARLRGQSSDDSEAVDVLRRRSSNPRCKCLFSGDLI